MGEFIAGQIILGVVTYQNATTKWPKHKEKFDEVLTEKGYQIQTQPEPPK